MPESSAAISAAGINGDSFRALRPGDESTSSFLALRSSLKRISRAESGIRYIYSMRRNGSTIEFVVDDDYGIAPDAALTGEPYTNVPPCMPGGFTAPSSDLCPTTDPWGKTIPGYASIFNSQGTMVGIVGVNRDNSSR